MEMTVDNTPQVAPVQDSREALEARIKAAEANPQVSKTHQVVGGTVASEAQAQPETSPEPSKTPAVDGKKDSLQQFKGKDGQVDISKIEKANEHLKQGIKDSKEKLLEENKKLLSEYTKTRQELSAVGKMAPPTPGAPDESERVFLEKLAKAGDDPKILRQLIREEALEIVRPLQNEWEQGKQDRVASRLTDELVELAESGESWIITEGTGRFNDAFKARPWLLQSPTPYKDALKFIDAPRGPAPAPAQSGQAIPILGAGSAVPPPSSAPPATTEQRMTVLSAQFREALKWGDQASATKLMAEMSRLNNGR